jgi:F0F1-type ATP synthase assembly protein I
MIRREAGAVLLEAFARCPQCSRNDKVQKVTAVLASQAFTPLAQKLSPPDKPIAPTQPKPPMHKSQVTSSVIASIVLGLIILLGYLFIKETLFLISGLILIAFGIVPALREVGLQGQRKKEYQNWKQGIQNYEKAVEVWNLEVELWKELYYCARDDSVFVLGANKFASSSHVTEYVRNLQDNKIKLVLTAKQQKPLAQDDSQSSQAVSIAPWIVLILVLGVCLGGAILLAVLYK